MSCLETYATLRIFSQTLGAEEISHAIGIEPTRIDRRDAESKYKHRQEWHFWAWSTKRELHPEDALAHIRQIAVLLDGRVAQLDQLRAEGCEIDISCYWVSSGQGGPFLDAALLRALADLKLEIWWDIYFGTSEEYAANHENGTSTSDA